MSYIGSFYDDYTGVRATPELVGRVEVTAQITEAIADTPQNHIIYITGPGGIGKTRLVRQILTQPSSEVLMARQLIDLYHTPTHTVDGLIEAISEVLSTHPHDFARYHRERQLWLEYLITPAERGAELAQQRDKMFQTFLADFNALAAQKRLVLVLDTVEKLFYQEDPAAKALELEQVRPAILRWLTDTFLPAIHNTVVILAGRLGAGTLANTLSQVPQQAFQNINLLGLSEVETLAYFEAVARRAEVSSNAHDQEAAARIKELPLEIQQAVFHSLRDAGPQPHIRPILLAMAIDHLVVASELLPVFTEPLSKIQNYSDSQREEVQQTLSQALVQSIRENRRPADKLIEILGWLRRGANPELLAYITQLSTEAVKTHLSQILDLSFIKIRPHDDRIFLHDEVYDLLQNQGLETQRQTVLERTKIYYDQRTDSLRNEIDLVYQPLADAFKDTTPDVQRINLARHQLQEALVESLHYRLRLNPLLGFEYHFRQAEEAVAAYDDELGIQLRTELQGFLIERDPSGQLPVVEGLSRGVVIADEAVRWIEWLLNNKRRTEARQVVEKLRGPHQTIMTQGDELARAELDSWASQFLAYQEAEPLLQQAIQRLEATPPPQRTARWAGILARAYNRLGYRYRVQNRNHRAIEYYQRALRLWRGVKSEVEQANTLNNLAFALAEVGDTDAALQYAHEGLRLRERSGPGTPAGSSLNILAGVELRRDGFDRAMRYAQRALENFTTFETPRGQGIALGYLAEATRHLGFSRTYWQQKRTPEFLEQSLGYIQRAKEIFTRQVQEPGRLIDILIEEGRTYRDWARVRREVPTILSLQEKAQGHIYTVETLAQQSEQALRQAITLAEQRNLIYRQIEAWIVLGWLRYDTLLYVYHAEFEAQYQQLDQEILSHIETLIPSQYRLTSTEKASRDSYLRHLGDLARLRGHIAFNHWKGNPDSAQLAYTIEQYTLALVYYQQYSDKPIREMRRLQEQIYERFSVLSGHVLSQIHQRVAQVEQTYHLTSSPMHEFLQARFGEAEESLTWSF